MDKTGGYLVLDDSFTRGVFQNSFKRVFARAKTEEGELLMSFNGEITGMLHAVYRDNILLYLFEHS